MPILRPKLQVLRGRESECGSECLGDCPSKIGAIMIFMQVASLRPNMGAFSFGLRPGARLRRLLQGLRLEELPSHVYRLLGDSKALYLGPWGFERRQTGPWWQSSSKASGRPSPSRTRTLLVRAKCASRRGSARRSFSLQKREGSGPRRPGSLGRSIACKTGRRAEALLPAEMRERRRQLEDSGGSWEARAARQLSGWQGRNSQEEAAERAAAEAGCAQTLLPFLLYRVETRPESESCLTGRNPRTESRVHHALPLGVPDFQGSASRIAPHFTRGHARINLNSLKASKACFSL